MSNFLTSSIGKKLIMSITGAFMVFFIIFHMCMNLTAVFSTDAYNWICGFLGANWYAIVATLILAAGVAIHIFYAIYLTLQNRKARGEQRYAMTARQEGVMWSSKNMFVLGVVIAGGLLMHLYNFWYKMQFSELMGEHVNSVGLSPSDGAGMLLDQFSNVWLSAAYIIWLVAIWLHLTHGVWSMFQSAGLSSKVWIKRLKVVSNIVATLVVFGFAFVVIVFTMRANGVCLMCI